MRAIAFLSLFTFLTSGAAGFAEQVTLAQAYDRMLSEGIEFGQIAAELDMSAEAVKQAKGQRLPRVTLSFEYDQIQQDIISSDNTAYAEGTSNFPKTSLNLTLRQPIYDAVKFRELPLAKARDAVQQAQAEVARNDVVRELITAYLDVARAQLRADRQQAIIDGRREYEDSLREEIAAGRMQEDALIRAEGETLSAEGDLMSAEMDKAEALAALQRFTGPTVTGVSVNGARIGVVDLNSLDRSLSEERLVQMSPDVQAARAALDVAKRQKASAVGALHPSVDLVLDFAHEQTEGSLFGGGSETQTVTGGVMMSVPIYEGGINRSRMREADAGIKAAELRLRQTEKVVLGRYKSLMAAARASAKRAGTLSQSQRLAEETLRTAQEELDAGRSSQAVLFEQRLRRDTLRLDVQAARLDQMRVQAGLYALFGAFDMTRISAQAGG